MDKREIEIVPGDGKIDISPAEDNINEVVDNENRPKKEDIVIPVPKKKENE